MMPLNLADPGQEYTILKVSGPAEVRQHLADLGFVPGGTATVINVLGGNVIIKVKESRVALGEDLVRRIFV